MDGNKDIAVQYNGNLSGKRRRVSSILTTAL